MENFGGDYDLNPSSGEVDQHDPAREDYLYEADLEAEDADPLEHQLFPETLVFIGLLATEIVNEAVQQVMEYEDEEVFLSNPIHSRQINGELAQAGRTFIIDDGSGDKALLIDFSDEGNASDEERTTIIVDIKSKPETIETAKTTSSLIDKPIVVMELDEFAPPMDPSTTDQPSMKHTNEESIQAAHSNATEREESSPVVTINDWIKDLMFQQTDNSSASSETVAMPETGMLPILETNFEEPTIESIVNLPEETVPTQGLQFEAKPATSFDTKDRQQPLTTEYQQTMKHTTQTFLKKISRETVIPETDRQMDLIASNRASIVTPDSTPFTFVPTDSPHEKSTPKSITQAIIEARNNIQMQEKLPIAPSELDDSLPRERAPDPPPEYSPHDPLAVRPDPINRQPSAPYLEEDIDRIAPKQIPLDLDRPVPIAPREPLPSPSRVMPVTPPVTDTIVPAPNGERAIDVERGVDVANGNTAANGLPSQRNGQPIRGRPVPAKNQSPPRNGCATHCSWICNLVIFTLTLAFCLAVVVYLNYDEKSL